MERMMYQLRLAALLLLCVAMGQSASASTTVNAGFQALAQFESGSTTARVKRWTRARLEAAKKHWAEDQQSFRECSLKLDEKKKTRRHLSLHRQGHFLENCMREKH